MFNKNALYKFDFLLIGAITILVFIGILTIYSAGFDPIDKVNNGMYKKQLLWFIISFIIMLIFSIIDYKILGEIAPFVYGGFLLLLIITVIFGTPVRNIKAWLDFGFFSLQPSELMKVATLLLLAKYIEAREQEIGHFRELFIPALMVLIPVILILLQPDFGTASLFIPMLFLMLFLGGADISQLVAILGIAAIAILVPMFLSFMEWNGANSSSAIFRFFRGNAWLYVTSGLLFLVATVTFVLHFFYKRKIFRKIYIPSIVISAGFFLAMIMIRHLREYQKKRILVFLNTDIDPHGSGYNIIQSKIAIGSGKFFGKGFLEGSQTQLGFLPEKTSDFIFPVIAEEWGFLGALVVIGLEFFIIFRGIQIALEARDKFGALVAAGISLIFFTHTIINIGMVIGIMPVTGLPLCFVSYGGSNLLMSMIAIGILNNIRMNKFAN